MANILLIEPNLPLAKMYQLALRRAKHQVTWRRNAQAAIAAADSDKPDLIILELQLSHHNGVEFLFELRSYPDWRDIPVIVLSIIPGLNEPPHELLRKQLGVRSCLYKYETTMAQLVECVSDELVLATAA